MEYKITVKANARKSEILEEKDDFLKIAISAPAYDGKANEELIKFLKKEKDWSCIITKGKHSKNKIIRI